MRASLVSRPTRCPGSECNALDTAWGGMRPCNQRGWVNRDAHPTDSSRTASG
jgi:hypothetical protein